MAGAMFGSLLVCMKRRLHASCIDIINLFNFDGEYDAAFDLFFVIAFTTFFNLLRPSLTSARVFNKFFLNVDFCDLDVCMFSIVRSEPNEEECWG